MLIIDIKGILHGNYQKILLLTKLNLVCSDFHHQFPHRRYIGGQALFVLLENHMGIDASLFHNIHAVRYYPDGIADDPSPALQQFII